MTFCLPHFFQDQKPVVKGEDGGEGGGSEHIRLQVKGQVWKPQRGNLQGGVAGEELHG